MIVTRIIGIPGSLRKASFNHALLRAAGRLLPDGAELSIETLNGIPVYDGDVEEESGQPQRVVELQRSIAGADGVLLATPEYNAGVPGAAKNALDWISRGDGGNALSGKPVALIGTGGRGGTRFSQSAWLPTMRYFGARLYSDKALFAAQAWTLFDEDLELSDETTRELLGELVAGFAAFCDQRSA